MSKMLAKERMTRVLGISSTGFPIFPIRGSEGEEDEGKQGEGDGGKEGTSGQTGGTGEGGSTAPPPVTTISLEEHETILRRLAAADKAKGEAEKRLKELDDADKSELEKAQRDLKEMQDRLEKAEAAALSAKLSSEILKFPGYTWHDPEAVLKMVDMDTITVDAETGAVKGVNDALKKLAKDKPYLLKGKQGDEKKDGKTGGNGASGHNPGGGGETADKNKVRAKLANKYKLR